MRILMLLVVLMSVPTSVSHSTHVICVADCVPDATSWLIELSLREPLRGRPCAATSPTLFTASAPPGGPLGFYLRWQASSGAGVDVGEVDFHGRSYRASFAIKGTALARAAHLHLQSVTEPTDLQIEFYIGAQREISAAEALAVLRRQVPRLVVRQAGTP